MAQPDFWEALLPPQICLPDTQPWTGAVSQEGGWPHRAVAQGLPHQPHPQAWVFEVLPLFLPDTSLPARALRLPCSYTSCLGWAAAPSSILRLASVQGQIFCTEGGHCLA